MPQQATHAIASASFTVLVKEDIGENMTKEKLAKLVNSSMLKANVAKDEIVLGEITKKLWSAIDKYIASKSTN